MNHHLKITALLLLCPLINTTKGADFLMFNGRATSVWDGDTFTVQLSETSRQFLRPYLTPNEFLTGVVAVQLAGINCPERARNHPFWQQSRLQLIRYLNNRLLNIQIEVNSIGQVNRSASRFFAVVRVGRNAMAVNQAMVSAGWAKDDFQYSFGYPYIMSQWDAMNRRRGIWADPDQYHAENEFRIRLYGTERSACETYPEYRGRDDTPRKFNQSTSTEHAQQPRWREMPGKTRYNVPQFKNP